jgi:hypothetical protein
MRRSNQADRVSTTRHTHLAAHLCNAVIASASRDIVLSVAALLPSLAYRPNGAFQTVGLNESISLRAKPGQYSLPLLGLHLAENTSLQTTAGDL